MQRHDATKKKTKGGSPRTRQHHVVVVDQEDELVAAVGELGRHPQDEVFHYKRKKKDVQVGCCSVVWSGSKKRRTQKQPSLRTFLPQFGKGTRDGIKVGRLVEAQERAKVLGVAPHNVVWPRVDLVQLCRVDSRDTGEVQRGGGSWGEGGSKRQAADDA